MKVGGVYYLLPRVRSWLITTCEGNQDPSKGFLEHHPNERGLYPAPLRTPRIVARVAALKTGRFLERLPHHSGDRFSRDEDRSRVI